MKHILITEGRRSIGGGQIMTKRLCDVLGEHYNVSVLIPDGDTPISRYLCSTQQFYYPLIEYSRGHKGLIDLWYFLVNFRNGYRSIKQILKDEKIDLIYIQAPSAIPAVACLARKYKIKAIVHLHVYHVDAKSRYLLNILLRLKVFFSIIGVSNYTLSQLSSENRKKSVVLHNYISGFCKCLPPSLSNKNRMIIAVIGDVMKVKGQKILFDALNSTSLNVELLIIGRIVESDYYDQIVGKKYNFPFNFTGYIEKVLPYSRQIDLIVIPSISPFETFSLSMVEAWGCGIPTIASSLGGMKELVNKFLSHHKDILLFEALDTENLKRNIEKILQDDSVYKEISTEVYNVSKTFSQENFESQLKSIINDSLTN